jgi:hypothetical protein
LSARTAALKVMDFVNGSSSSVNTEVMSRLILLLLLLRAPAACASPPRMSIWLFSEALGSLLSRPTASQPSLRNSAPAASIASPPPSLNSAPLTVKSTLVLVPLCRRNSCPSSEAACSAARPAESCRPKGFRRGSRNRVVPVAPTVAVPLTLYQPAPAWVARSLQPWLMAVW